jgi:hypothetical protein
MRMQAYLPVSIQAQDMNPQRLAILELAGRDQLTVDGFVEVSPFQATVSIIAITKNTRVDSATMYHSIRFRERG